jgi:ribosomal protein S18 acetylase RimI-like enzyme
MFTSSSAAEQELAPRIRVGKVATLDGGALLDLCDATEAAIADGIGFNWLTVPLRETLETYWKGVLMVPERTLIGAWVDGVLCGSIQLVRPGRSHETSFFCAHIEGHFVAPWARGHGIANQLLQQAEREATLAGFSVIRLSVRETQTAALGLYRDNGYSEWGVLPAYEYVGGQMLAGHFFYKTLEVPSMME